MINREFLRRDWPLWYGFGFKNGVLSIEVEPNAFAFLIETVDARPERIKRVRTAAQLDEFVPPRETCWGFCRAFESVGESSGGWRRFVMRYPSVLGLHGDDDDRPLYASVASLHVALSILNLWAPIEQVGERQAVMVSGLHPIAGGIGVGLSATTVAWLHSRTERDVLPIRDAMFVAARALGADYGDDRVRDFPLQLANGALHLGLPVRVGLHPDTSEFVDGNGYILHEHNVDSPYHQLGLLAGVAKLSELVLAGRS